MRVLLFGDPTRWVPKHMAKLGKLAEVYSIPRTPAAQVSANIQEAVQKHGPFDVFCVRL
jgi:hypothetical protein